MLITVKLTRANQGLQLFLSFLPKLPMTAWFCNIANKHEQLKKRYIQILTILITSAFVGLIVIQIYWVNNSILLRQQEFEFNVNQAMQAVSHKLEKLESHRKASSKAGGISSVSLDNNSDAKKILYNFGDDRGIETIKGDPAKDGVLVPVPIDKNVHSDRLATIESIDEAQHQQDSLLFSEWGEYGSPHSEIMEQAGFLEDILDGTMSVDIVAGIEERVDVLILDSLIRHELEARGVKAKFYHGIFNKFHQPELLTAVNAEYKERLFSEGYKIQLFLNDTYQDPSFLRIYFPHAKRYLVTTMWVMLSISAVLILLIMYAFTHTISTIYRQKKLSLIKNDFINNMTHELKTPISTISLACEALADPDMMQSQKQMKTFVGMISTENKRLGALVENVLRSAILDKGDMVLRIESLNMHDLIKEVIKNIAIQVKKKGGTISTDLLAVSPVIQVDRIHLTNLVYNLIDNAIKYSLDNPEVTITSEDRDGGVLLTFKDNGIGISRENQKKIFDRLYRVPTGNVHDVKGFGLGLSYVQAIVERHHGEINVVSELNKGSNFIIYLPASHEKED